ERDPRLALGDEAGQGVGERDDAPGPGLDGGGRPGGGRRAGPARGGGHAPVARAERGPRAPPPRPPGPPAALGAWRRQSEGGGAERGGLPSPSGRGSS